MLRVLYRSLCLVLDDLVKPRACVHHQVYLGSVGIAVCSLKYAAAGLETLGLRPLGDGLALIPSLGRGAG